MNEEQKHRYDQLRNKNKDELKKKKRQENILLNECITALGENGIVIEEEEELVVYNYFRETLPFSYSGIEWNKIRGIKQIITFNNISNLSKSCSRDYYYIIWGKGIPIIKSNIEAILSNIDDIIAVEADTWLLSTDYEEIIEFFHEGKVTLGIIGS